MDEFETYEDVIDAYNANDMGYSTLTDYIKGQNIKIKEISMEPLADLQRSLFENKADGGMIGIEVLFKEKMKDGGRAGFFMGGPALEGRALSIYNSMKDYGATDQAIADRLAALGLYTPGGTTPDTPDTGIINQQLQTGGGGGDGGSNVPTGSKFATLEKTYDPTKNYGEFFSGVKGTPSMVSNYQTPPTFIEGLLSIPGKLVEGYMDISSKFNPITRFIKDRAERQQTLQDNAIAKAEAERKAREEIARAEAEAKLEAERRSKIGAQLQAAAEAGGGYQPTTTAQNVSRTSSRVDSSGGVKAYGLKDGGLATMFTRRR